MTLCNGSILSESPFYLTHILVPNLGKELKVQIDTFSFSASVNFAIDSSGSITCLPPCSILPGNIDCSEKDLHSFRFNFKAENVYCQHNSCSMIAGNATFHVRK
ncbi:hypothetical protein CDAR_579691 [Caerostris darwini]|uniref:Uncharacterized protein n=1 Tax=Caerostris darwini TaxID=1538125 RepID=A0AAV4RTU7_9ARAC|nr:hypothetical protein CDAR_579691 [Caerostris darwini]